MTTSTMERAPRRTGKTWEPSLSAVLGAAAVIGAVSAFCEDATLRLVLWAFLG